MFSTTITSNICSTLHQSENIGDSTRSASVSESIPTGYEKGVFSTETSSSMWNRVVLPPLQVVNINNRWFSLDDNLLLMYKSLKKNKLIETVPITVVKTDAVPPGIRTLMAQRTSSCLERDEDDSELLSSSSEESLTATDSDKHNETERRTERKKRIRRLNKGRHNTPISRIPGSTSPTAEDSGDGDVSSTND